ncbi:MULTISPECIES: YrhB domain-containing protein [unclassified Chryseobacterium]|uniref:YrhB domain-containing protein n=1 Tax=unclassified Chryseobacterium TaxID=2593645 RepID=UPI0028530612|nr:YrhB domain-containing protein [Chryseobacterium sp. CFS7]MDR4891790.1 YrhB domain-containing protein [Chryseobacterium sp. CFS7]
MMLTDKETLVIAERYLQRLSKRGKDIEVMIYLDEIIKKPYGNIYFYNSKEYILTGNFNKSLVGNAPFLVEKKTGRVVGFGTSGRLEDYITSYENGTLPTALDTYWYPDEDRFDYK